MPERSDGLEGASIPILLNHDQAVTAEKLGRFGFDSHLADPVTS